MRPTMEVVLFGQGDLARVVLDRLISEHVAVLFVNDSEGPEGALCGLAQEYSLPAHTFHPRRQKDELAREISVQSGSVSVLLSVNFRYIIDESILGSFKWPLNIHGSLLPKYRGRTPHVWAIINGETETGVTLHVMDAGVDTGPIVAQRNVPIGDATTGADLIEQYKALYPNLVMNGLKSISDGIHPQPQNEAHATFFGKRTPDMGLIDFRLTLKQLRNFVRAIAPPYPGAFCHLVDGRKVLVRDVILRPDLSDLELPYYSPRRYQGDVVVRTDDGVVELTVD